jgi:hypothetical protein
MKLRSLLYSCLFIALLFTSLSASAQLTQTIRGTVTDVASNTPLVGAQIVIFNEENSLGGLTDDDGDYRIENVPVGRYDVICSYVGYEDKSLYQIEVTSSKQVILNFGMNENIQQMKTTSLTFTRDKRKTQNKLVSVSGRTFSIEESQRYAGSRGDVARMAQNFAGVQGANDFRNDIIVRGNSPIGVLYRIDGVDIPNPNHFSAAGTTGGPVSMLNNNVLQNSDFLTGAFPAEFANTTSAVFDLGLRNGNNDKHEFLGQVGFAGFELMAEGPLSKNSKASYLVDYRYSVLGIFQLLGFQFGTGVAIPQYQDLTFKLNFPDKRGSTSVFGIGGLSEIKLFQSEDDNSNAYGNDYEDLAYGTKTGVIGLVRKHKLGARTNAKFVLATNASATRTVLDTFSVENGEIRNYGAFYRDNSHQGKYTAYAQLDHKFNSRSSLKAGVRFHSYFFELKDSFYDSDYGFWVEPTNFNGRTSLIHAFVNERYRINQRVRVNIGVNASHYAFNGSTSIEPRSGIRYRVNNKYSVSAGYGLHSLLPPFRIYFEEVVDRNGNRTKINQDLGFSKSHHVVLSNDINTGKHSRLKIELYYQHMFDVPVDGDTALYYSMLNQGADFGVGFTENMVNNGLGRNAGFELTYERFMNKGFYFLNTVSIYRSLYTAQDGIEYPTVFDSRYALNVLGGKEFYFSEKTNKKGKTSKSSMTVDLKLMVNGGQRHTPVNEALSKQMQEVIYIRNRTNELQYEDYARFDLRIAYKVQTKKMTQEWGVDIQNLTNRDNIFSRNYDLETGSYVTTNQTGILPIGLYRITF